MKFILFSFLAFLFGTAGVFAQSHSTEFGAQTDNDSYLLKGSDRYYTDGTFIYYRHALKINGGDSTLLANKILGFETGQKIFNPQSGFVPGPQYVDRPFAAYLYVGSTLNLLYKNESTLKLGAQLGVVGPAALGEQVQKFIHQTFGFYPVGGWQYQIKNDVEINLSAEYNKLIARTSGLDVSFSGYANLGNGFTGAGAGPLVRIGLFNQLFHSVSTQSTTIRNETIAPLHRQEIFFYYKPQFNYVAYDATIQGGLFEKHNDPNSLEIVQTKEPFIFSQQFGIAFTTKRFVVDAAAIYHTKDVKEMVRKHQWGSITALYRFK
ncbi:MAG TPA: lipid A deacylase LpxR family protein [Mucilaginibacter sp.]|jgi:lipid A 3-O-deacylase|nr:lipid A deacylase LpxR family protein [Mucilaginibacter sp.]